MNIPQGPGSNILRELGTNATLMSLRAIVALLLCGLFTSVRLSAQDTGARVYRQVAGAVAWVVTRSPDSLFAMRSAGVVLKEQGWLLTTFHGYKHGGHISARVGSAQLQLGRLITADSQRDLVVLEITGTEPAAAWSKVPTLRTRKSGSIVPGMDGYAIGNPGGAELVISHGLVSGLRMPNARSARALVQFSAPVSEGNSGGALVDAHGALLGLPTAWYADGGGQALNYALPIDEVFAAVAAPRNDLPPLDPAWLEAARAYLKGDCLHAQELFIGLMAANGPHAHEAAYRSARCMQRHGDLVNARNIYERLVVIDPLDAKSLYRLGEVLLAQGDTQRAFELRQRAGRLQPDLLLSEQWD